MRKLKTYQVARRHREKSNRLSQLHTQSASLPTSPKHIQSRSENIQNIFGNNEELRLRALQTKEERDFSVLGLKQFKVYNALKQKKRKDLKSHQDHICSFLSSFSSESDQKLLESGYLTKDQLLLKHTSSTLKAKPTLSKNKSNLLVSSNISNIQESYQSSWISSIEKTLYQGDSMREKFSLSKLKDRMNTYKKSWEKYMNNDKPANKASVLLRKVGKVSRNTVGEKKLTNIQKKMFFNEQGSKKIKQQWRQTLRHNRQHLQSKLQRAEITKQDGLSLSGKSKLRKQKQWIEKKHSDGFFFSTKKCLFH